MDLFNVKRVEELERELAKTKRELEYTKEENNSLKFNLNRMENDFNAAINAKANIPKDCVPGEYCQACEFVKEYYKYYSSYNYATKLRHSNEVTGYICDRANVCKNFIQKKEND